MSLFRTEVIEAQRRKLWGDVRLSQSPSLTIWTITLTSVGVCIILCLVFGTYLHKETVRGYLAPEGGIVQITPDHGAKVAKIFVQEGEHVNVGQALIEFSGESSGTNTGQVLSAQIAEIEKQIRNIRDRKSAAFVGERGERDRIRAQIEAQSDQKDILSQQVKDQTEMTKIAETELEQYGKLVAQGYASQMQLNQKKQQFLVQKYSLNNLQKEIGSLSASIADNKIQLAQLPAKSIESRASFDGDLSSLEQRRIDLSATQTFIERAPVAGIISSVQADVDQSVAARQPLISIMPESAAMQAEILVPTRASGFLGKGQEVRLQVDAYPFQKYGFVTGKIVSISRSVLMPNEFLAPIEFKEAVYRVRVSIANDYITAYGKKMPLTPGMSLTADIVIERKPLWRQLFDPLLAARKRAQ